MSAYAAAETDAIALVAEIGGVLLLASGVASCQMRSDPQGMASMFIAGALLYGGCKVASWLRRREK